MAQAKRDQNRVITMLALSNADGVTPYAIYADPATHRMIISSTAGTVTARTDARRDENRIPTLLAVSQTDEITPVTLMADATTHGLLVTT
jgi:hypothetical protein